MSNLRNQRQRYTGHPFLMILGHRRSTPNSVIFRFYQKDGDIPLIENNTSEIREFKSHNRGYTSPPRYENRQPYTINQSTTPTRQEIAPEIKYRASNDQNSRIPKIEESHNLSPVNNNHVPPLPSLISRTRIQVCLTTIQTVLASEMTNYTPHPESAK